MSTRSRRRLAAAAVLVVLTLLIPTAVVAYRAYSSPTQRSVLDQYRLDTSTGEPRWVLNGPPALPIEQEDEAEIDDPRLRSMAHLEIWGKESPAYRARKLAIAREEAERWADTLPRAPSALDFMAAPDPTIAPTPGGPAAMSWVNLGPTDALFEWNGTQYFEVDSGRGAGILVDPADPQIVYFATSGGGIWKTFNYGVANPTWHPITETLGNIAIGNMDLDPTAPETLHVGIGDAFDLEEGHMVKTTTGGATWGAPVQLAGTYPAGAGGLAVTAGSIREVRVDPSDPQRIFVTTNVGLFRSTDGGGSYALVDLPNSSTQLAEATWSVAYAGSSASGSRIVVSGVYACAQGLKPPDAGYGVPAGTNIPGTTTPCAGGNPGDIWYSTTSGATWTSLRTAGGMPSTTVGRITLAAGGPKADPATTVLYAQLGSLNEGSSAGAGLWRSNTGGASFVSANGTLANRTNLVWGSRDCGDINVNNAQAWYNSTLSVDPGNDNNVLVGGMLCGLRTTSGLAGSPVWENVAHWLPTGGGGDVTGGTLPYVHADWHRTRIVRFGSTIRAFAGTDGGIFHSDNLFAGATPPAVTWAFPNRGIVSHLVYSVGSGDPATGNPFVVTMGLQDNGTRFRDSVAAPTTFNQVIGGDGFGTAVSRDSGGNAVYYGSVYSSSGRRRRCVPSGANNQCNQGGAFASTSLSLNTGCGSDSEPFITRLDAAQGAASPTFLSSTYYGIYKAVGTGAWSLLNAGCLGGASIRGMHGAHASESTDGVIGVPLTGGRAAVTSNCGGGTTACTWTVSQQIAFDANGNGTIEANERMAYTADVAFPAGPTGRPAGDVYAVALQAPGVASDGVTPMAPGLGLVWRTQDRGTTWTPIDGNGTGFDLPMVPVNVVRYDPSDSSNNTLFAGTDLGVYRTTDGGNTWHRFGVGLPLVRVNDMVVGKTGAVLRVATYGRGVWELYPSATAERGVAGNGDFDRDLQLDFIDLAATAARLGTNPATTAQPYYDWNQDQIAPAPPNNVNAIDEGDLNQLLSRFGDRP